MFPEISDPSPVSRGLFLDPPVGRWAFPVPVAILVAVLAIEFALRDIVVTPMLLLLALAVLALRLPPRRLVLWAVLYAGAAIFALGRGWMLHGSPGSGASLAIRSVTFLIGGGVATLAAVLRQRSLEHIESMLEIVDLVPAPIVVSDGAGIIQFTNKAATQLIAAQEGSVLGNSFFALFQATESKGSQVQNYAALCESEAPEERQVSLRLPSGQRLGALQQSVKILGQRYVVTVMGEVLGESRAAG